MSTRRILSLAVALCTCLAAVGSPALPNARKMEKTVEKTLDFSAVQAMRMFDSVKDIPGVLPNQTENGKLVTCYPSSQEWVPGFFPGELWYLYENTSDPRIRKAADLLTKRLEAEQYDVDMHDVGFVLNCSYGNGYRLTGNEEYRQVLINGANSLATRFNPTVGCTRSWNPRNGWDFIVIIDNMMNLELLTVSSALSGDPKNYELAKIHANTTIRNHFREDNSSFHVVNYSEATGEVISRVTCQGLADDSAWARGQAWGLYGFTMMYRETGDRAYLEQACKIADFICNHPNLPKDKIPYWDFDAPASRKTPRDASAAAIMASALIELSQYVDGDSSSRYLTLSEDMMKSLASRKYRAARVGDNANFLLKHSTGHYAVGSYDTAKIYADYYFVEALMRYKRLLQGRSAVDASSIWSRIPEPDAKIVYVDGMPKISLNGKILNPEFNQSGAHNAYKVRAAKHMDSLGININQLILHSGEYEVEPGVYSFEAYEKKVLQLLENVPDGRILLLVRLEFRKWLEAHPSERIEYANGPIVDSGDERINRVARPSPASLAYRAEVKNFLSQLGAFTLSRPWGNRVIAVRPSWGVYTEWHMYAFDQGPDIGPAMTEAFHKWKDGLYANESLPTMEERIDNADPFFLDREKHRKVLDYFECQANVVTDCLLETAHATKEAFPGRLVGMYYGYVMTVHEPEGANVMLDKVLASPDVDFLSDPADYTKNSRLPGGAYYHRTIPATFHRYGKLAMLEDDMRHYHVYDQVSHQYICTRNEQEAEMTTRRNWLNQYFDGCGIQMLDPEVGQDSRPFLMDTPPVWRAIEDTKKVLEEIGGRPAVSGNKIAVVVDWRGRLQRSSSEDSVFYLIYKESMWGLYASGVPFDLMTLDDFLAMPADRYRKAVFLNVVAPEGEMRAALEKRVRSRRFKSAWLVHCPFSLPESSAKVFEVSALPSGNDAWREVLEDLGETPIGPAGHLVRRHGNVVMFHTGEAGTYTLNLPKGMSKVKELYSGCEYDSSRIVLETEGSDTFLFKAIR